jgi:hypothetical protein
LQTIYFSLCTINIILKSIKLSKKKKSQREQESSKLDEWCNFIYTSLAFPMGVLVTCLFWGVYLVDRNLMYPPIMDTVIPSYQNHLVHTLPMIGVVLDNFLTRHYYQNSFARGVSTTLIFSFGYLIWLI